MKSREIEKGDAGKTPHGIDLTAFVEVSVDSAGCSHAAFGRGPEPAAYLLDFLLIQFTSTLANQYSALVIHTFFSFRSLGPLSGPQTRQEGFGWWRGERHLLS